MAKVNLKSKGSTVLEFDQEAMARRNEAVQAESDSDILIRLNERFDALHDMTQAVKSGDIRAMIVSGPPGVGKSFGVEDVLSKDDLFDKLGNRKPRYEIVKGAMSALGLYAKLYEFAGEKNVLVFDDCDDILMEELSLNILKGALDSSRKRYIAWNTDSRLLRSEGIPDRFEFKGAAIFITNIKFEMVRSKKLKAHLDALESRCHYMDLEMDSNREKLLWIKNIVENKGMLVHYEFEEAEVVELLQFVNEKQDRLRELSLRMVLKIADLKKSFPNSWKAMAATTCMRKI